VTVSVIVGKKLNELFSSQCIIHRVIQEENPIFWDVIVSVIEGKSSTILLTMHYIQGDSGGKIYVFGCDFIGHCEKEVE